MDEDRRVRLSIRLLGAYQDDIPPSAAATLAVEIMEAELRGARLARDAIARDLSEMAPAGVAVYWMSLDDAALMRIVEEGVEANRTRGPSPAPDEKPQNTGSLAQAHPGAEWRVGPETERCSTGTGTAHAETPSSPTPREEWIAALVAQFEPLAAEFGWRRAAMISAEIAAEWAERLARAALAAQRQRVTGEPAPPIPWVEAMREEAGDGR